MSVVVKKFGGTSVANLERIEFVAEKIFKFSQQKQQLVVVVSAMNGETDRLENLAYQITEEPDPREMAALLATGEQLVISLLAMALIKRGCPARSYTGLQLGVETDGIANKAWIKNINTKNIYNDLQAGKVVIVAGFQGVDSNGNITTLGRGGSDTTAVALSVALQVKECHIYTDVDGVYTADPNLVPDAKRLDSIHFLEMLELSGLGAKVMQIRAVELGSYYNLPTRVLSGFNEEDTVSTLISADRNSLEYSHVVKIATLSGEIKVSIKNIEQNNLEFILKNFASLQIEIDMLTSCLGIAGSNYEISFVINKKYLEKCKAILNKAGINNGLVSYVQVAKLSLVGLGLSSNPEIISKIYSDLLQSNIVVLQVVTSEIKVSVLLNEIDLELASKILHTTFLEKIEKLQESTQYV